MKESLPGRAPVRPLPYRPMPSEKLNHYRQYRRKRQRAQRLMLVFLGIASLLLLTGWVLSHAHRSWSAWNGDSTDTTQLENILERDFGFGDRLSLLYYQALPGWATARLERDAGEAFMANALLSSPRLLPIVGAHQDESLKSKLEALFARYPRERFTPYLYLYNPQERTYVEINGYAPVPAASVIKLPILLDYLTRLDQQEILPGTPLLYADFYRAGGAGTLQYQPSGVALSANDVAGQMIRISDNTCTNIMIDSLGGMDAVNRHLAHLGLVETRIRRWLPDLSGTNTISPYEMVTILYNLENRQVVSDDVRQNGIDILKSTHNRRLLVTPLPREAVVAHKTGDIGTSLGDSGIIYMPDGRKYMLSIQVERPYNDYTARDLVQQASRLIYDYIAQTPVSPLPSSGDVNLLSGRTSSSATP